jgi:hypothetical protein
MMQSTFCSCRVRRLTLHYIALIGPDHNGEFTLPNPQTRMKRWATPSGWVNSNRRDVVWLQGMWIERLACGLRREGGKEGLPPVQTEGGAVS